MSAEMTKLQKQYAGSSEGETASLPDLHDRITEAYFGKMGDEFARSTRERIHWICSNVTGKRVLDVGCSQGITAVLLGREGKSVIGIDVAKRSVEEAREYLSQETIRVQEQVGFVQGDFLTSNLGTDDFDTVIMAEVLEHLTRPEAFISTAAERLGENGRLIVTVPFGINDWLDHKKTFYFGEPWRLITDRFNIDEVKFFGKWIGFVATLRSGSDAPTTVTWLEDGLLQTEAAFLEIERQLLKRVNTLAKEAGEIRDNLRATDEQNAALKQTTAENEAARAGLAQALAELKENSQRTEDTLEALRTEMQATQTQFLAEKTGLSSENDRLEIRLEEHKRKIVSLNDAITDSETACGALQDQVLDLQSVTSEKDKEVARLTAELSASQRWTKHHEIEAQKKFLALEAERSAHVESEKQRILIEHQAEEMASRLTKFESQLEQAHQNLRERTEEVSFLQSRVEQLRAEQDDKEKDLEAEIRTLQKQANDFKRKYEETEQASQAVVAASETTSRELKSTQKALIEAEANLDALAAEERSARLKSDEAERRAQQTNSRLMAFRTELDQLQKQKAHAEQQAAKTRAMISFQLGHALIQAKTSWRGLAALPKLLVEISKDAKRRKSARSASKRIVPVENPKCGLSAEPIFDPDTTRWSGFGKVTRPQPRALTILDPISEVNWSTDFWGTRFVRTRAQAQADSEDYDLILMESVWRGFQDDWLFAMTSPGLKHANAQALVALLKHLRSGENKAAAKPIVMINKEDPLHYDKFLPVMRYADHIFTTDADMVEAYRRDTDALSVTAMPFAANLTLTNPVGRVREPQEDVCFAGSYYSEGHEERARQMQFMMEPIKAFKGAIYDRMSAHDNQRYHFPERFRGFIRPAVEFKEMAKLYRRFGVFLNVNTITTSPTMMSRRVYELLASGTPVVSAPSRALEEQFAGIVPMATTAREAEVEVGRLLSDNRHWWKTSQKGIREVALKHQYKHRGALIRQIVLGQQVDQRPPLVSVVMATKRWMFLDRIVENLSRQVHPRMEILFALRDSWPAEKVSELENRLHGLPNVERLKILTFPETASLGVKLNAAVAAAQGEFVAKMDDDDWYFANYLQDMVLTFDFSGADLAGKWSFPVWLEGEDKLILRNPDHEHTLSPPLVAGPTLMARRSWLEKLPFADRSQGEDTDLIRRTVAAGGKIYSADHFNFIQFRAAEIGHHTWQADAELFLRTGRLVGGGKDFEDWVV